MTEGRTAGRTHSADCANPAVLKENHTFEGDRPAHDGRVKAHLGADERPPFVSEFYLHFKL